MYCDFCCLLIVRVPVRFSNTVANHTVEAHRKSKLAHTRIEESKAVETTAPRDYK